MKMPLRYLYLINRQNLWVCKQGWAAYPHENVPRLSKLFVEITPWGAMLVILKRSNHSKALQAHPVYGGIFTRANARATPAPSTFALALWDYLSQDRYRIWRNWQITCFVHQISKICTCEQARTGVKLPFVNRDIWQWKISHLQLCLSRNFSL